MGLFRGVLVCPGVQCFKSSSWGALGSFGSFQWAGHSSLGGLGAAGTGGSGVCGGVRDRWSWARNGPPLPQRGHVITRFRASLAPSQVRRVHGGSLSRLLERDFGTSTTRHPPTQLPIHPRQQHAPTPHQVYLNLSREVCSSLLSFITGPSALLAKLPRPRPCLRTVSQCPLSTTLCTLF